MKDFSSIVQPGQEGHAPSNGKKNDTSKHASSVYVETDPATVEHYEIIKEDASQPARKRSRVRNHCVRFWLCYLIGSIVLLAITLPLS